MKRTAAVQVDSEQATEPNPPDTTPGGSGFPETVRGVVGLRLRHRKGASMAGDELQLGGVYDIVVEHRVTHDHFPMKKVTYRGIATWWFGVDLEVTSHLFQVGDDPWPHAIPKNRLRPRA